MNVRSELRMEKAQFFAWLERQERKHELADGRVVMLPNVTRNHWLMTTNVVVALGARLDRTRLDFGPGDFAVETGERSVRYADVMVTSRSSAGGERSTRDALLLVEIASPSTVHVDFGEKLREYQTLPTLGSYMICAQDEARVWVWTRADGKWPDEPDIIEGMTASVAIPILNTAIPLQEIYMNISLR